METLFDLLLILCGATAWYLVQVVTWFFGLRRDSEQSADSTHLLWLGVGAAAFGFFAFGIGTLNGNNTLGEALALSLGAFLAFAICYAGRRTALALRRWWEACRKR